MTMFFEYLLYGVIGLVFLVFLGGVMLLAISRINNAPAPAVAGAVTPFYQKWWFILLAVCITLIGGWIVYKSGMIQTLTVTTAIIVLAVLITGGVVVFGAIGHYRAGSAKGSMALVSGIAVIAVILTTLFLLFGEAAVKRGFEDLHGIGESFASRPVNAEDTPPTSGTYQVTDYRYIGKAQGGTYTLTDNQWLVFHWPDGQCVPVKNSAPVLERLRDRRDEYWILSRDGEQQIIVNTLLPGETWNGYTC